MLSLQRGFGSVDQINGPIGRDTVLAFDILSGLDMSRSDADALIQQIARTMPGGNRTNRMTQRRRYDVVDDAIATLLEGRFDGPVRVRDLGVSNAIVSAELFRRLVHVPGLTLEASDHMTTIRRVTLPSGWRVIFDECGQWMQAVRGTEHIFAARPFRLLSILQHFRASHLAREFIPAATEALAGAVPISLFHPEAEALAATESRFTLTRRDLFDLPPASSEVVRVMTVIFGWSPTRQQAAIVAIGRSLVENGLLVIGKGRRASNMKCSIFERRGTRLVWLQDVGKVARERANVEAVSLST